MDVIKDINKLMDEYKNTGFKLFEFDSDMKYCYKESLQEMSMELVTKNCTLKKKMDSGIINAYDVYVERIKIRIEYELINTCIAIIDGSVKSVNVFMQILQDIYNSDTEKQLTYDLAKLKK